MKGLGILTLKQQSIISTLNESIQDKKNWKHREGKFVPCLKDHRQIVAGLAIWLVEDSAWLFKKYYNL